MLVYLLQAIRPKQVTVYPDDICSVLWTGETYLVEFQNGQRARLGRASLVSLTGSYNYAMLDKLARRLSGQWHTVQMIGGRIVNH